ncbi:tetratricopeptide repeat protein [Ideonella oryzae]|uniref:Tetratricopeptide repeat protein n=1 Tax=Ideonella oryzae TaxID=2937441 RepID=A0ABT1BLW0_9BURK|nr:tetratricopeptide repeat protein [Ideonella oryzae]MCO5977207.1 tetratricopeptide repeat protein [Ideonella oryzae]
MKLRLVRAVNRRLLPATAGHAAAAPFARRWLGRAGLGAGWLLSAALGALAVSAPAQPNAAPAPATVPASAPASGAAAAETAPVNNSWLDAPMFYELLLGEMEVSTGHPADGFEVMLDAARRSRDGTVFQRAIEIAVQGRSGDRALLAARAWRQSLPQSIEALRTQVQLLVATEKLDELAGPLKELIERQPEAERSPVIAGLPRFLAGVRDKAQALSVGQTALAPYLDLPATRTAARTSLGRLAAAAQQSDLAMGYLQQAHQDDPAAAGPVLLALDLMGPKPEAEAVVKDYLARPDALTALRLAYVQSLEQRQRLVDAVAQLRLTVAQQPDMAQAWLSLGALLTELQEPREGIQALDRYFALQAPPAAGEGDASDDDNQDERLRRTYDYACVVQADAHEQLGELKEATRWLDKVPAERTDLALLVRRASLMVRQGQVEAGLALVKNGAARGNPDARARLLAQAQVLRDAGRQQAAFDLLGEAVKQSPEDSGLVYEQAMLAEQLKQYDAMEALLREVIRLKADDAQAYNALGYSLAERGVRLDEALKLIQHAVELAPDDPFILDSLGWVYFRQGRADEALKLLKQSYAARPHAEVATHLGEVLWAMGQRDEALRYWREAQQRERDNTALRETLQRLKVKL